MIETATILKLQQDVGEALSKELMLVYITETRKLLRQLKLAWQQLQVQEVIAISHSLKSSSKTFGAQGLGVLCEEIEQAAKANKQAQLLSLFEQLTHVGDDSLQSLIQYT